MKTRLVIRFCNGGSGILMRLVCALIVRKLWLCFFLTQAMRSFLKQQKLEFQND